MVSRAFSARRAAPALVALTILALAAAPAGAVERIGGAAIPLSETLRLAIDPADSAYSGTATVQLRVPQATDSLRFCAQDLRLTRVELFGGGGRRVLGTRVSDEGMVTARAAAPVPAGNYRLEVDFTRPYDRHARGLYKVEVDGTGYTFTDFEPDDARRAWPCWDEPSFKIPWDVAVTVPAGDRAIGNGLVARETVAGARKTVVFRRSPPLPSYLVELAVGPFELVPLPGMSVPGNVVVPKGRTALTGEAVRIVPAALAALEGYFGSPYPFAKLDVLAVPEFFPGAMENPGAVTFREDLLLPGSGIVSVRAQSRLASTVTHELAHMWFGDLVTLAWWDDLWLNESFASWLGDDLTARTFPEFGGDVRIVREAEQAFALDQHAAARAMRRPLGPGDPLTGIFDALAYEKGQAVLGMVEAWLGRETFRRGVVDYVHRHAWKNATSADFAAALSRAAGRDVTPVLTGFLDQPGVPLVSIETHANDVVTLTQRRFLAASAGADTATGDSALWQIPVFLKYGDEEGLHTQSVLLTQRSQDVKLASGAPAAWIDANAGGRGYYRWNTSAGMLGNLAAHAGEWLTPRERIGLLADTGALLDAGLFGGERFLLLLPQFADDPEPQVAEQVLDGLRLVRTAFVDDTDRAGFAAYVRRLLTPTLARWGRARVPGEAPGVSLLRPDLLVWLGDAGQGPEVLAYADSLGALYRSGRPGVEPPLVDPVLQLAATRGDLALFRDYRARFEGAQLPAERTRWLTALAWFDDPALIDSVLDYALFGPMRPQDFSTVGRVLGERGRAPDRIFRWITEHYDAILARTSPYMALYLPSYASGCSRARLAAAEEFFGQPGHRVPGVADEMKRVADAVNECAALADREGPAVRAFLAKQAASAP